MNWREFSKETPQDKPKRRLLIWCQKRGVYVMFSDDPAILPISNRSHTHWAEINPPFEPDPFKEWWLTAPYPHDAPEEYKARITWGAAIQHAKGEK